MKYSGRRKYAIYTKLKDQISSQVTQENASQMLAVAKSKILEALPTLDTDDITEVEDLYLSVALLYSAASYVVATQAVQESGGGKTFTEALNGVGGEDVVSFLSTTTFEDVDQETLSKFIAIDVLYQPGDQSWAGLHDKMTAVVVKLITRQEFDKIADMLKGQPVAVAAVDLKSPVSAYLSYLGQELRRHGITKVASDAAETPIQQILIDKYIAVNKLNNRIKSKDILTSRDVKFAQEQIFSCLLPEQPTWAERKLLQGLASVLDLDERVNEQNSSEMLEDAEIKILATLPTLDIDNSTEVENLYLTIEQLIQAATLVLAKNKAAENQISFEEALSQIAHAEVVSFLKDNIFKDVDHQTLSAFTAIQKKYPPEKQHWAALHTTMMDQIVGPSLEESGAQQITSDTPAATLKKLVSDYRDLLIKELGKNGIALTNLKAAKDLPQENLVARFKAIDALHNRIKQKETLRPQDLKFTQATLLTCRLSEPSRSERVILTRSGIFEETAYADLEKLASAKVNQQNASEILISAKNKILKSLPTLDIDNKTEVENLYLRVAQLIEAARIDLAKNKAAENQLSFKEAYSSISSNEVDVYIRDKIFNDVDDPQTLSTFLAIQKLYASSQFPWAHLRTDMYMAARTLIGEQRGAEIVFQMTKQIQTADDLQSLVSGYRNYLITELQKNGMSPDALNANTPLKENLAERFKAIDALNDRVQAKHILRPQDLRFAEEKIRSCLSNEPNVAERTSIQSLADFLHLNIDVFGALKKQVCDKVNYGNASTMLADAKTKMLTTFPTLDIDNIAELDELYLTVAQLIDAATIIRVREYTEQDKPLSIKEAQGKAAEEMVSYLQDNVFKDVDDQILSTFIAIQEKYAGQKQPWHDLHTTMDKVARAKLGETKYERTKSEVDTQQVNARDLKISVSAYLDHLKLELKENGMSPTNLKTAETPIEKNLAERFSAIEALNTRIQNKSFLRTSDVTFAKQQVKTCLEKEPSWTERPFLQQLTDVLSLGLKPLYRAFFSKERDHQKAVDESLNPKMGG